MYREWTEMDIRVINYKLDVWHKFETVEEFLTWCTDNFNHKDYGIFKMVNGDFISMKREKV